MHASCQRKHWLLAGLDRLVFPRGFLHRLRLELRRGSVEMDERTPRQQQQRCRDANGRSVGQSLGIAAQEQPRDGHTTAVNASRRTDVTSCSPCVSSLAPLYQPTPLLI
jgi:hypothetical protein